MPGPAKTWDEARAVLESRLDRSPEQELADVKQVIRWPDELTRAWLADKFSLGSREILDEDFHEVEGIGAEYRERLVSLAEQFNELRRQYTRQEWNLQRFKPRVFTNWSSHPGAYAGKADFDGGWSYAFALDSSNAPLMGDVRRELQRLRLERDDRIIAYLARPRR